ncbi:MAG: GTP-dependent dephospho-CoA kinase family protein [Methanolinea sp.]|nr:GTP-dependent dephospho-CoA kinase family protein [Methanolinea sp.]
MRRLPEDKRHFFKAPFGRLFSEFHDLIPQITGRTVYTVGDIVTRNALKMGVFPAIAVVDGHTMREPCETTPDVFQRIIRAKNPPGTLTDELICALEDAVAFPPALLVVDGEEDLAVIPLILIAPVGGVVLYGQPGQGVVLSVIDKGARRKAASMIAYFIEVDE